MEGKTKCKILKGIRQRIADANNITYHPHPCDIEKCNIGTCDICDSELAYLESQIKKREKEGYPIYLKKDELN